ncbi:Peptidyl-prolyl cis-trans isomerase FKBP2 [Galdieria sulphuraria]|nr:Peptidyl-prolyl cis-trans isomerase FKBP2 [Galdieria sulphuraria]
MKKRLKQRKQPTWLLQQRAFLVTACIAVLYGIYIRINYQSNSEETSAFISYFEDFLQSHQQRDWIDTSDLFVRTESNDNPWNLAFLKERYPNVDLSWNKLEDPKTFKRKGVIVHKHRNVVGCGGTYVAGASWGDFVHLRFIGKLDNGTVFDSTRGRKQLFRFQLGWKNISRGWNIGLLGMCPGEIRELVITSKLFSNDEKNLYFPNWKDRKLYYLIQLVCIGEDASPPEHHFRQWKDPYELLREHTVIIPAKRKQNCYRACQLKNLVCFKKGFSILNNCPTLSEYFDCRECEIATMESAGSDMPCRVSLKAPSTYSSGTERLCPCVVATDMLLEKTQYLRI